MSQDLSFEHPEFCFFATIRTICSRLWLVNNSNLEERILAYLARYQERYKVLIYNFILMGNHYHLIAKFPEGNKAAFFRDFNGMIAKLTASRVEAFEGGKLWARRVRTQVLPNAADIEEKFFYASLNPVSAGLVQKVSEYPGYNGFADAVYGRNRTFKVVNWEDYNSRKRFNPGLTIAECTSIHTLRYSRLPGFESLTKQIYAKRMNDELERRRVDIVKIRIEQGGGFATRATLLQQRPGATPHVTKTSKRNSHRPLVLTLCAETRKRFLDWYFSLYSAYKAASRIFRAGNFAAMFPPGTYRPVSYCSPH